ncbi:MAG TPA: hypothetical protein PKJ41_06020 [Bryobacteraceae bacterium]|nr:hypothetical protein [Bryobacteraceae bacterium]
MPPALLRKLPHLPPDRIVGHGVGLKDTQAGLILDVIPDAIA